MNIVMLESLGVSRTCLEQYTKPLEKAGHTVVCYERDDNENLQDVYKRQILKRYNRKKICRWRWHRSMKLK